MPPRSTYQAPTDVQVVPLERVFGPRDVPPEKRRRLLPNIADSADEPTVFAAGEVGLVDSPSVAIVGSRKVSAEGARRAQKLARGLANAGVVVVSGLAEGVDFNAHTAAIEAGGRTIGVLGTALDKAYPAKHAPLQERIYREHLLISQFRPGDRVHRSNFPQRNKLMAAITDATVIIEASNTSGTLHQASECARIGRWLFIAKSVVDDPRLDWPQKFLGGRQVRVLEQVSDVLEVVRRAD